MARLNKGSTDCILITTSASHSQTEPSHINPMRTVRGRYGMISFGPSFPAQTCMHNALEIAVQY